MAAVPSDAEVARLVHAPHGRPAAPPTPRCRGEPAVLELRYPLAGEDVWGATARILRTFSGVDAVRPQPAGPAPADAAAGRAPSR